MSRLDDLIEFADDSGLGDLAHEAEIDLASLRAEIEAKNARIAEAESLLAEASPHIDSLLCPSVKKVVDEWTHESLCLRITEFLKEIK